MIDNFEKSIPFFKFGAPNRAPYYYIYSLTHARNEGLWLEFGTHDGTTINLIAGIMHAYGKEKETMYGFDSFEGLPESWEEEKTSTTRAEKGHFDLKGKLPNVQFDNIRLVKGWFDETIPKFLKLKKESVAMIHIDSDLYSSALTVLEGLKERMKPGTVILFDQLQNGSGKYPGYKEHEYRAWAEFSEKYKVDYEWLAYVKDDCQASLIIKEIKI